MTELAGAETVLSVRGLTVDFPGATGPLRAVRGIDFDLRRGECLGIVGESGSGKSVTAAALLGLIGAGAQVRGAILLDGRDMLALDREKLRAMRGSKIAMIFQEPSRSFDPIYSIGKTFEEALRTKRPSMSGAACREKAITLLTEVHISRPEERLKNFPHQFSGGMLQRIMIALALAGDPEVLIADEPTTALDVTIQSQIVALLKELQARRRLSLVFISHDLALVGQAAERLLVMYAGIAMETGPAAAVLSAPHSPYTSALLRSLPAWGSHYSKEPLATISGGVPDPTRPEPGCPFAPRCPLAEERCRVAVPPLSTAGREPEIEGHRYRCVVAGVKS